jgi:hypothetical protein
VIEITAERAQYGPKGRKGLPGVLVAKTPLWQGGPRFAAVPGGEAGEATAAVKGCECEAE